jgi:hypothetical protein
MAPTLEMPHMTEMRPPGKPYKTAELAEMYHKSQRTIARWIDAGYFGEEGVGWEWTSGGHGKGDRVVYAEVIRKLREGGGGPQ